MFSVATWVGPSRSRGEPDGLDGDLVTVGQALRRVTEPVRVGYGSAVELTGGEGHAAFVVVTAAVVVVVSSAAVVSRAASSRCVAAAAGHHQDDGQPQPISPLLPQRYLPLLMRFEELGPGARGQGPR
jgi:hypothetical protein